MESATVDLRKRELEAARIRVQAALGQSGRVTAAGDVAPASLVRQGEVPLLYLNANILLPQYLRSVFLDLTDAGLVRVHWSRQVLERSGAT